MVPPKKKHREEDQRNRVEDPVMNPHGYVHLIFDKVTKRYDGENTSSSMNVTGKTGYLHEEI
jgi:hypothetical protein